MASFDNAAFMRAEYEARKEKVKVSALADYFPEGAAPEWEVRGQTASEIAQAMDAVSSSKSIDAIITAIANTANQIDEIKKAIGISDDVPDDVAKRLTQLVTCSTSPEIDMPLAVKLAEVFPIEFFILTNTIVKLTGLGMDIPKSKPSGKTKALETK